MGSSANTEEATLETKLEFFGSSEDYELLESKFMETFNASEYDVMYDGNPDTGRRKAIAERKECQFKLERSVDGSVRFEYNPSDDPSSEVEQDLSEFLNEIGIWQMNIPDNSRTSLPRSPYIFD